MQTLRTQQMIDGYQEYTALRAIVQRVIAHAEVEVEYGPTGDATGAAIRAAECASVLLARVGAAGRHVSLID